MLQLAGIVTSGVLAALGFLVFASPSWSDQLYARYIMYAGAAVAMLTIASFAYRPMRILLRVVVGFVWATFVVLWLIHMSYRPG